jgi:DNA-binding MarR family transcriptional regulator
MSATGRDQEIRQARNRALVNTLHRHELEDAGEARRIAEAAAVAQLDRIARHLPGALNAGLSLAEISRITGVSRPTLYELQKRYGRVADPRFEVLAGLASEGPQTVKELASRLEEDAEKVRRIVRDLTRRAWAERVGDSPERGGGLVGLTTHGEDALAGWELGGSFEDRTTKPLRIALDLLRFTPEERQDIERKISRAEAEGKSRLGLMESLRMGVVASLDDVLRKPPTTKRAPRATDADPSAT